jgi:hypothetical protein
MDFSSQRETGSRGAYHTIKKWKGSRTVCFYDVKWAKAIREHNAFTYALRTQRTDLCIALSDGGSNDISGVDIFSGRQVLREITPEGTDVEFQAFHYQKSLVGSSNSYARWLCESELFRNLKLLRNI